MRKILMAMAIGMGIGQGGAELASWVPEGEEIELTCAEVAGWDLYECEDEGVCDLTEECQDEE
jgi:hypothetical protein